MDHYVNYGESLLNVTIHHFRVNTLRQFNMSVSETTMAAFVPTITA